ncbi:AAA family ATPase [Streptococcus suis]|uniref:AAA family ATPase n=1 Tax=Streptococcus suis TaxID=1307 RepID=UPI00192DE4D5|nr:AAA family ATPase [Streptococcus suis]MBL6440775.1 AAA family ATPase [Streptococcus suis]
MKSFRIQNLRSIKDSQEIFINKCNLFIGANGTGKSSILRFFPLLKQTISQKNSSPILWYARDGVDFGSYNESINKEDRDKGIKFSLRFNEQLEIIDNQLASSILKKFSKQIKNQWLFWDFEFHTMRSESTVLLNDVEIEIKNDRFSSLEISFDDNSVRFDFDKNGIYIDGEKIKDIKLFAQKEEYPLLPLIYTEIKDDKVSIEELYMQNILDLVLSDINANINDKTKQMVLSRINYRKDFSSILDSLTVSKLPITITKKFEKNQLFNRKNLQYFVLICFASKLIPYINRIISDYFTNTIYVAPIRATAERYYRVQGLSVEEVDPMGTNVPMILDYMNSNNSWKKSWQNWTMKNFGTMYQAKTAGGNTSIEVFIDGEYFNLADTGFGYSQFLPILLMLWQEEQRNNDIGEIAESNFFNFEFFQEEHARKVVIIEQPELHLHPKMQDQFANLLFNIVTNPTSRVDFIIETHSTVIINKIGELIEKSNYSNENTEIEDNFNLYLVNNNSSDKKIVRTQYDKDGVIKEWPIGFL